MEKTQSSLNAISLILIGAAITFVSTYLIERIKDLKELRSKTQNFKLYVKLELDVIAKTLEKLQTGLSYGRFYDYMLLDRIKESVDNLEKVRSDIIYLSDTELKEKFIDVISDISTFIATTRMTQQLFYTDRDKATGDQKEPEIYSKNSSKPNKTKVSEEAVDMAWKNFNERRTEKTIEYVEIKRKLEDLIKSLTD